MTKYAILDSNNKITTIVEAPNGWTSPDGSNTVPVTHDDVYAHDSWDGTKFVPHVHDNTVVKHVPTIQRWVTNHTLMLVSLLPISSNVLQLLLSAIAANGGTVPTTGAFPAQFASVATILGVAPATVATALYTLQSDVISLTLAQSVCTNALSTAKTPQDITSAMTAFNLSVTAFQTSVNATLGTPVTFPPALAFRGLF